MENLNQVQLRKLYSDFLRYRDEECEGLAKIGIKEFYAKKKADYKEVELDQCDSCNLGLPVVVGIHRNMDGIPNSICANGLYA